MMKKHRDRVQADTYMTEVARAADAACDEVLREDRTQRRHGRPLKTA